MRDAQRHPLKYIYYQRQILVRSRTRATRATGAWFELMVADSIIWSISFQKDYGIIRLIENDNMLVRRGQMHHIS
jgi:hypothetical protein